MKQRARDLLVLGGLALLANGAVALLVSVPGYVDAAYYFNGGRALAEGRGLVDPYLWNYVGAPPSLPVPAFAYWQPLPSFLAALGIALFGRGSQHSLAPAFGAAQAIYVIVSAALPLITYSFVLQVGQRRHALIAGLIAVFSGYYVVFWSLPESFTPFALAGSGALFLVGLGRRTGRAWAWLLAGACAGLGHLARADGVLLVGVVMLVAVLPVRSIGDKHVGSPLRRRLVHATLGLVGYVVIMAPWLARNWVAFGSPQAPGGPSTLWLIEYNDLFNYPPNLTPERFFAAGAGPILRARWQALIGNLSTFVGVHNLVFLTPFTVIGLWRRWRDDLFLPFVLYGLALFGVMTAVFALPGLRGGWLHSGAALEPFVLAAAIMGLDDAIRWASQHRRSWRPDLAWRVFNVAGVIMAIGVTIFVVLTRVVGLSDLTTVDWNRTVYDAIGSDLDAVAAPAHAVVISNNPPGFYTHTGRWGVPIPNGDEQTLLRAADAYGATFLVIDHNVPEGLWNFYQHGPSSGRFALIKRYGDPDTPVYLYRILPGDGPTGECGCDRP